MKKLNEIVMTAVYCYLFPEVWPILKQVENAIPRKYHLTTTPVGELSEISTLFDPPLELPANKQGYFDEDEVHVPILERIVQKNKPLVPALGDFSYSYPTPGSSEGIFKLLAMFKANGINTINVLEGEYEGFQEYAGPEDLKMAVHQHDLDTLKPETIRKGLWFISNPSARDGNIIYNDVINNICDAGHQVVLDLAYVGSTAAYEFDVSHENILAVVFSLSKPYGVFRKRIGATFSREPIHSLYGNKWFKDSVRLLQGLKLVEELGPDEHGNTKLYTRYGPVQEDIIAAINEETDLGMRVSDVFLLGHLTEEDTEGLSKEQLGMIAPYKRGKDYRFCITPCYEILENPLSNVMKLLK